MSLLTVVAPAPRRSLTTPERLTDELGDLGKTAAQLEVLIERATGVVERFCSRVFARERVLEEIEGQILAPIFLDRSPVVEIHALIDTEGASIAPGVLAIENAATGEARFSRSMGWAGGLDTAVAHAEALLVSGDRPYGYRRERRRVIEVEYTGGYAVPALDGTGTPDLPADVEGATIRLVATWIERADPKRGADLTGLRLGDAAWQYKAASELPGIPADVASMLMPWRRVGI